MRWWGNAYGFEPQGGTAAGTARTVVHLVGVRLRDGRAARRVWVERSQSMFTSPTRRISNATRSRKPRRRPGSSRRSSREFMLAARTTTRLTRWTLSAVWPCGMGSPAQTPTASRTTCRSIAWGSCSRAGNRFCWRCGHGCGGHTAMRRRSWPRACCTAWGEWARPEPRLSTPGGSPTTIAPCCSSPLPRRATSAPASSTWWALEIPTAETAVEPRLTEVLRWLDEHPGWLLLVDNVRHARRRRRGPVPARPARGRSRADHLTDRQLAGGSRAAGAAPAGRVRRRRVPAGPHAPPPLQARRRFDRHGGRPPARPARPRSGAGRRLCRQEAAQLRRVPRALGEEACRGPALARRDGDGLPGERGGDLGDDIRRSSARPDSGCSRCFRGWPPSPCRCRCSSRYLAAAVPEPRDVLADLAGYSLVRFAGADDAVEVHRLVQEITRSRTAEPERGPTLQLALEAVNETGAVRGH